MQLVHHLKLHYAKNTGDAGEGAIQVSKASVN